ncbi:hypothetical protein V2O64_00600 [Verrucomicrobiaceae bacterium 227]
MAKITDQQVQAAFALHLHEGETLQSWAYGVKQPKMLIIVGLIALGILPGVIAVVLLTKNYFIGLTGRRLIVLQVKGVKPEKVKEVTEYDLSGLSHANASTSTGSLFTHIEIKDEEKPFKAKFHRAFCKSNRPNAIAIGETISA